MPYAIWDAEKGYDCLAICVSLEILARRWGWSGSYVFPDTHKFECDVDWRNFHSG